MAYVSDHLSSIVVNIAFKTTEVKSCTISNKTLLDWPKELIECEHEMKTKAETSV